jgi:signal transduction histidine kinase
MPAPDDLLTLPPYTEGQDRRAFLKSVSHELRTPLNAIIGFSEIMSHELNGPLPESYRGYADIISENGRHMLQLVDDLFEIALARAVDKAA